MRICYKCIGDEYLSQEVRLGGKRAACGFCGKHRKSYPIEEIAEYVRSAVEGHYRPNRDEYGADDGQPITDLIADLLNCAPDLADAVRSEISEATSWEAHDGGYSDPFSSEACYVEKPADIYDFQETWDFFQTQIRTQSRYFSEAAKSALEDIFGDLTQAATWQGEPVIRTLGPGGGQSYAYRARIAFSERELETILRNPCKELGPPPSCVAQPGRMNAKGISVFYGAMEKETCIAEVRAPVGSHVVIGQFEFTRELRLLDLDRLTSIYTSASVFDPQYAALIGRARFLGHLVNEISRPVMPRDEEAEYLVTQVVAEFLATCTEPPLDGVLFDSAQTDGAGHNILLFHHASGVETLNLPPGTEVDIDMGWASEDDYDDRIVIWEITPRPPLVPEKPKPEPKRPSLNLASLIVAPREEETDQEEDIIAFSLKPSLRLAVADIEVRRIQSVQYCAPQRSVYRYRQKEGYDELLTGPVMFPYFAYGSNMSSDRLRFRVQDCRPLGLATLVGYELRFHKVSKDGSAKCNAFYTGDPSSLVVGVLYNVPRSQKKALDDAEGAGKGYDVELVSVVKPDGTLIEAVTYLADSVSIDTSLKPYTWYKDFVLQGAIEHELPAKYIEEFIGSVDAVPDWNSAREKKSRAKMTKPPKFEL